MKREKVIEGIEARIAHDEVIRDMVKCVPLGQLVRLRVGCGYCVVVVISFNHYSMVCDEIGRAHV